MLRRITLVFATLTFLLLAYEANAVYVAHRSLPDKLSRILLNSQSTGLTPAQLQQLVRVQDPSYYTHSGIEWPNPLGTTTITQSLVKRLFFQEFRPGFRKLEQTLIARFVVNARASKRDQLMAFVATAYFGNLNSQAIYGFRAGAQAWFAKPIESLTKDEFLALVAMLPAPKILVPGSEASASRVARIKLLLAGKCTHNRIADICLEQCNV